jgi:hypothetical protein
MVESCIGHRLVPAPEAAFICRALCFADGPDEVHREQIARLELVEQLAGTGDSDKAASGNMAARRR